MSLTRLYPEQVIKLGNKLSAGVIGRLKPPIFGTPMLDIRYLHAPPPSGPCCQPISDNAKVINKENIK